MFKQTHTILVDPLVGPLWDAFHLIEGGMRACDFLLCVLRFRFRFLCLCIVIVIVIVIIIIILLLIIIVVVMFNVYSQLP